MDEEEPAPSTIHNRQFDIKHSNCTFTKRKKQIEKSGVECLVVGCNNRTGKDRKAGTKRSYYTLPKDLHLRKLWLKAIPRANWQPKAWHRICSDHFTGGKRSRVPDTPGYVPSIFPMKQQKSTPARKTRASQKAMTPAEQIPNRPSTSSNTSCTLTNAVWQTTCHDYIATQTDFTPPTESEMLMMRISELEEENSKLKDRLLSVSTLKDSDKDFRFYTNMPNYYVFKALSDYLNDRAAGQLKYWRGSDSAKHHHFSETMSSRPGPGRKLSFEEEFFLTLVKIKTGSSNKDLALRFGVTESLVTTWFNFLCVELKLLFEMKDDDENVAACYQGFRGLKVVLDCTEQQCERASDLQARKETFSNYKQRDTIKWLIGLSKNLTVNFVSHAYGGRASDKFITLDSPALLQNLTEGSSVLADRGFLVTEELKSLGVELIIPDFKGRDRSQMKIEECLNSEEISKARIHIERIIQRIRTNHILDTTVKLSMKDIYHQMFTTCAYLCNFQLPIVQTKKCTELVDSL